VDLVGQVVAHLAADVDYQLDKSGKVLITSDLRRKYGLKDVYDGDAIRGLASILRFKGLPALAAFVPRWIRVPHVVIHLFSNKFG